MKFNKGEYIVFEKVEDFYDGLNWAIKEFNCEIESYFIYEVYGEKKLIMKGSTVKVGEMWIEPKYTDVDNLCNIAKMIQYIDEYFDVKFVLVDINIIG